MTVLILTVVLCAVAIGTVVWAVHLDLRDEAERWAWLREWEEQR